MHAKVCGIGISGIHVLDRETKELRRDQRHPKASIAFRLGSAFLEMAAESSPFAEYSLARAGLAYKPH